MPPETDEDGESEGEAKQTVFVHCTPAVRAKWHRARFLASRMEGHPLPAWMVAERLAAEALSAIPYDEAALERTLAEQAIDGTGAPEDEVGPRGCGDRTREAEASIASTGPASFSLSPEESPNGCAAHGFWTEGVVSGAVGAAANEAGASVCAAHDPLLAVARGRRYQPYGCSSLGEFAREWLGISPSKADALLRLERAGQIAPVLREAYRAGRLSWAQAQELVPLLRREGAEPWRAAWVAHAEQISVRRLSDEVARALARDELAPPPLDPPTGSWDDGGGGAVESGALNGGTTEIETADASSGGDAAAGDPDSQTGAHPTTFPKSMSFFFTAPRDVARVFRGALATVQRRIERKNYRAASESEALDAILEHAFETWGLANAELQREHRVFERDREPLARYRSGDVLAS